MSKSRNLIRAVECLITVVIGIACVFTYFGLRVYLRELRLLNQQQHLEEQATSVSNKINISIFHRIRKSLDSLCRSESIKDTLTNEDPTHHACAVHVLQAVQQITNASIVYVMNPEGKVVASTSYLDSNGTLTSLEGKSYPFRPYFREAMAGRKTFYPALGVTTGVRGIYISGPISHDGEIIGCAVIKSSLEDIDQALASRNSQTMLLTPSGVVFAANNKEWMYRVPISYSDSDIDKLVASRQFSNQNLRRLPFSARSKSFDVNKQAYLCATSEARLYGSQKQRWLLILLSKRIDDYPLKSEQQYLISVIVAIISSFTLILLFMLFYLRQRQRLLWRLTQSEEKYRTLTDNLPVGVYRHSAERDGRLLEVNHALVKMFGFESREQLLGRSIADLYEREEDRSTITSRMLREGAVSAVEIPFHKQDGSAFLASVTAEPVQGPDGKIIYYDGVIEDVTERNRIREQLRDKEEQLFQAQKMESIGQLAGGIAHDFNNMLGGIIGASQLLLKRVKDEPKKRKYVELIADTARNASDLTDKLLTFSRKTRLGADPLDIHSLISDTIEILRSTLDRKITIKLDLISPLHYVIGDSARLQHCFINLGVNASDAMPEGGTLTINTRLRVLDDDYCRKSPFELTPGDFVEVTITDTGCGMTQDTVDRIFDPFFTTKPVGKGTGLGLSTVYGTIKDHHGEIKVESKLGNGTNFCILLPAIESDTVARLEEPDAVCLPESCCVLIVDDEAVIRTTVDDLLSELGYTVLTAGNGAEALDVYREHAKEIDVILLDLIMPGMNGRETLQELVAMDNSVKVIIATGGTGSTFSDLLACSNVKDIIQKPYFQGELLRKLTEACHSDT